MGSSVSHSDTATHKKDRTVKFHEIAIDCFFNVFLSIGGVTIVGSVIHWSLGLLSSWETWQDSRQRIVKRHPWRLLEQHWPPWARVGGRWGSRYQGDVWDVLYTMVYLNLWLIEGKWWPSGFKGKLVLDPDLREAESAVIAAFHSMLGMYALQKRSPETDLGATNCDQRYLTDCYCNHSICFSDKHVAPQLCMWAFQTGDP